MPTTTNYGWTTPADTDLVKDGAAAIRTLGNSVDTTTKNLNPETTLGDISYRSSTANTNTRLPIGTTGQVLTVVGGVPAWSSETGDITEVQAGTGISVASGTGPIPVVTNTVATAFDAKGDLVAGTGADTFAKLTVGANNTVLTADSTTATGLKWAAAGANASYSLLNTGGTALTGSTTVTVSGISSMNRLYILVQLASSVNANSEIRLRFNSDSTSKYMQNTMQSFTTWDANSPDSFTEIKLGNIGSSATQRLLANVFVDGCNSSGLKVGNWSASYDGSGGTSNIGGFVYSGTSTISSVSVISSSGNLDNGTIYVYGSAN